MLHCYTTTQHYSLQILLLLGLEYTDLSLTLPLTGPGATYSDGKIVKYFRNP